MINHVALDVSPGDDVAPSLGVVTSTPADTPAPGRTSPRVVVVGAGFGGLGTARALLSRGVTDVTVLERGDSVGGVWRDNTYPKAACDVPSPLYSWSWAPNPRWGRRYSEQPEILDYIRRTAQEEGLLPLKVPPQQLRSPCPGVEGWGECARAHLCEALSNFFEK